MASDIDPVPPVDFVQASHLVPDVTTPRSTDNLPAICHTDLRCTNTVLCPLSLQCLAHPIGFDHTRSNTSDVICTPPAVCFDNKTDATNTGVKGQGP